MSRSSEKEILSFLGEKHMFHMPTGTKRDSAEEIAKKYGLGELQYCERLHVKANELPCGKRDECYWEPVCPKVGTGIRYCKCCGKLLEDATQVFCSKDCSRTYNLKNIRGRKGGSELLHPKDEWDEIIEANGL